MFIFLLFDRCDEYFFFRPSLFARLTKIRILTLIYVSKYNYFYYGSFVFTEGTGVCTAYAELLPLDLENIKV